MSKLYGKMYSDNSSTQKTASAHQELHVKLCYGSKNDSRCIPVDLTLSKEGNFILWVENEKFKTYKYP